MSKDYMEIGSVPANEPCIGVGQDDYHRISRTECSTFKQQLLRQWQDKLIPGVGFVIKSYPHDFGTYHEVCVVYDDDNEAQTDLAVEIQNEMPEKWDSEALA
jgi:hypothetical protein